MTSAIIHHAYRPIGNADILGVIVDVCKDTKAYGTILLVALMSKHHHAIVQPVLTRIKNRVVLNLDDYAWRNKENDQNIEIVYLDSHSPVPIDLAEESDSTSIPNQLQPTILQCRGRPWDGALKLWRSSFPCATIISFSEDARDQLDDKSSFYTGGSSHMKHVMKRYNKLLDTIIDDGDVQIGSNATVRYRLHRAYQQSAFDCPGQRIHLLRYEAGDNPAAIQSSACLRHYGFRQDHIVEECVSLHESILPTPAASPSLVTLDTYVQLPAHTPGPFFLGEADATDSIPPGYEDLSRMIDRVTPHVLRGTESQFVFRLFFLQHGSTIVDRAEMKPIYSSTTRLSRDDPAKAFAISRFYDEDFAMCIKNGRCGRCRE